MTHSQRFATVVYYIALIVAFTALTAVAIVKCFSPLTTLLHYKVKRTIEWYSLPTVTSNWHTLKLITILIPLATLSLRSFGRLLRLSFPPNLDTLCATWDSERRFC